MINAQHRVTYELRQKNRGKRYEITEQAINKVNLVQPYGINDDIANAMQETHKSLLRYSMEENNSDEVVALINTSTSEVTNFLKGTADTVDVLSDTDMFHLLMTSPDKSIILCHNHPRQTGYSFNDIAVFMHFGSIGTMTIVNNYGKVTTITKTAEFNFSAAAQEFHGLNEEYGADKDRIVDLFLKHGYNYGIERG